jgi:hypothetical protein
LLRARTYHLPSNVERGFSPLKIKEKTMFIWMRRALLGLCLLTAAAPAVAATPEPKAPYTGLNRQQAWEQNERWYEEVLEPVQAKLREVGDDFQARRISEATYARRSAEVQKKMGDLLRRKEQNSMRIVRHFDQLTSELAGGDRADKQPRRDGIYPVRLRKGRRQVQLPGGEWVPARKSRSGRWVPAR